MSGLYAQFVGTDGQPLDEPRCNVELTRNPECAGDDGLQFGGSAALAWPSALDRYRRGRATRHLREPAVADNPRDAGRRLGVHRGADLAGPAKPSRVWPLIRLRDNGSPSREDVHDWVLANQLMAAALAGKGYTYQFLFSRDAGHCDRAVKQQTLPQALEWLWKDDAAGSAAAR